MDRAESPPIPRVMSTDSLAPPGTMPRCESPANLSMVSFEVRPRDFYIYYVTVENPGDLLKWSFFTKKKNIAFGLYHLYSVMATGAVGGEETMTMEQVHRVIEESRGGVSIWPPPKGCSTQTMPSNTISRSNSVRGGSEGSLALPQAALESTASLSSANNNSTVHLTDAQANQADFYAATAAFGQGGRSAGQPFEFIEISPIERYESYESTIKGTYRVPMGGVYALCFDNTFSFNTSKTVFLNAKVIPHDLLADHGLLAEDESIVISGWMMKKRRKMIQGWSKRWVQLESNGILSYYESRAGSSRGWIDVRKSTVSRLPQRRLITLDSPQITFHLRALCEEDFEAWSAALKRFLDAAHPQAAPAHQQELARIEQMEGDIAVRIGHMATTIKQLRDLAATDDGSLGRYVGPLEQACHSLDELFREVCGLSSALHDLHHWRPTAEPAAAVPAVEEDVFYDMSEASSSSDEDGSEYADASETVTLLDGSYPSLGLVLPPSDVSRIEFQYRTSLPAPAPSCNISLASLLMKCIGKDTSGMVMPMGLNEPLNGLQRLCEELEYSDLLDRAAAAEDDPVERLVQVAAFAVSAYASSVNRADRKPFNPMLGETYEYIDAAKNIRFVSEKVSHRPIVFACHAAAPAWEWWQDLKIKTKPWGKSIEYKPSGSVNVRFANGDHFQWNKVISCLRNILSSQKYIENYGEMKISNLRTGDTATISFKTSGGFFGTSSSSSPNEVSGTIRCGARTIRISGRWDDLLMKETEGGRLEVVWKANPLPPQFREYYGFTQFAFRLNQLLPGQSDALPPSDTRLRPDQRMLEEALVEQAEAEQLRLIEKQRQVRAEMEARGEEWQPRWFHFHGDAWVYNGEYWPAKERRDWSRVPSLW